MVARTGPGPPLAILTLPSAAVHLAGTARPAYQAPVFGMLAQGSCGGSDPPFCRSSIEMPSGERMKAMWPSRGGRLMAAGVTIHRPPRDGYMAFIRSPDGISIELLQDGEPLAPKEPWASMGNTGSW